MACHRLGGLQPHLRLLRSGRRHAALQSRDHDPDGVPVDGHRDRVPARTRSHAALPRERTDAGAARRQRPRAHHAGRAESLDAMTDAAELLEREARGDEAAWREIVARYQRLVYATVRGFRLEPDDAEDVFQETFLRLHRHAGRLRNPNGLARWLVQTTHRLCLDHLQRRRVRGETTLTDQLRDPALDVSE